jgi:hypothetical protein
MRAIMAAPFSSVVRTVEAACDSLLDLPFLPEEMREEVAR